MVESAHKSKSSTRLFNWAWPPKKWRDQQDHLPLTSDAEPSSRPWRRSADEGFRGRRRQRQLSEQDICSMNRTSIPAHHDILDFDGMIITPPRRHSESNSPHDPSSTSSSISGSRRSTKASLRDFFSRKSQSHPSTLPLPTTATPPVSPPNHSGRQRLPSPVATPLPPSIEVSEHTERPPSSLPDPLSLPQHHPSLCLISSPPIPPRSSTLPMSASISNRAPSPPPQLSLHHSPTMPALTSNPSHPAIGSHRASFTHLPPLTHHFPELYPPHPQPSTYSLPMLAADEFADPLTPPMLDDTKRFSLRQDLVRLTLDGYFKSPITSDQERNVLHIGCGDGSWCLSTSKAYPNWYFYGMEDLTGGQFPPSALRYRNAAITSGGLDRLNGLPRNTHGNYQFIRSPTTLLDGLAWLPDGFFDLVYGQCLLLTLPKKDYKAMVSHAWRVCKPGGYVELTELDPILYAQFPLGKLTRWLNQRMLCVTKKQRLDPTMARHLQDLFFELLIQDQPSRQRQHYEVAYTSLPLGVWGGRIGVTFRDDLHDLWDALKVATLPVKSEEDPLSEQEWEDMTGTLDDTLDTEKCFMNLYQFYTKKHA